MTTKRSRALFAAMLCCLFLLSFGSAEQEVRPEDYAFVIPEGTVMIDDGQFANFAFESVYIPFSVKYIGARAFADNPRLKAIYIANPNITVSETFLEGCFIPRENFLAPEGSVIPEKYDEYFKYMKQIDNIVPATEKPVKTTATEKPTPTPEPATPTPKPTSKPATPKPTSKPATPTPKPTSKPTTPTPKPTSKPTSKPTLTPVPNTFKPAVTPAATPRSVTPTPRPVTTPVSTPWPTVTPRFVGAPTCAPEPEDIIEMDVLPLDDW